MSNNYNSHILLIESDESDLSVSLSVLQDDFCGTVDSIKDGNKALPYLRKEGIYNNALTPNLIILELNLTGTNGKEILSCLKKDKLLYQIPVIVYAASSEEKEIAECYNLGANCYVVKPQCREEFTNILKVIKKLWIENAALPFT